LSKIRPTKQNPEGLSQGKTQKRNSNDAVSMASSLFHFLLHHQKRSLCTKISSSKWKVKQVTISNFNESLEEIKTHISNSDFIAISMEKTGSSSTTPWHRVQPFDTAETAYLKASQSAQRFQLLQFAVCPFSVTDSNNLVAHP